MPSQLASQAKKKNPTTKSKKKSKKKSKENNNRVCASLPALLSHANYEILHMWAVL